MSRPPHLLSYSQFRTTSQLEDLFRLADRFNPLPSHGHRRLAAVRATRPASGRVLATLFYEPSTRTRLSFEAAQLRLGGGTISTEAAGVFSSHAKGETLEDTVQVVGAYCDCIVLRHPEVGAAERAAAVSVVPVINGGDGDNEHPTQALLDAYAIRCEMGLGGGARLRVALVGDLKHSRAIHSLLGLLSLYREVEFVLVSPDGLRLPARHDSILSDAGATVWSVDSMRAAVALQPDVVYMTRLQRERHTHGVTYLEAWEEFILTPELMGLLPDKAVVLHPLPRLDEVPRSLDADPRAAYFRQAGYGLAVRMAILANIYQNFKPVASLGLSCG